jgi:outer membrane protein assembly factor BamA
MFVRTFAFWLVLCAAHAALPSPAHSADTVAGNAFKGWRISGFSIEGIGDEVRESLKRGLVTAGRKRFTGTRYQPFSPRVLQADLDRSRLYLARNGYPFANVTPAFKPDPKARSVKITLRIEPGLLVRIAWFRTAGIPADLDSSRVNAILRAHVGDGFSDERMETYKNILTSRLTQRGHAKAIVTHQVTPIDPSSVGVILLADAGEIYYFGASHVEGIRSDLDDVVLRTMDVQRGKRYDPRDLERAAENLRALDLFRKIQVETRPAGGNVLDVFAVLTESDHRTVQAGGGYWTEDRIRLSALWKARNLFRAGRGLSLQGSYSRYLQSGTVSYWKPDAFHSRTRGEVDFTVQRQSEPTYRITSELVTLGAAYLPSSTTTILPSVSISTSQIKILAPGATFSNPGPALLSGAIDFARDRTDDRLYPRRGTYTHIYGETGFPGFLPRNVYTLFTPEQVLYVPLGRTLVWANRLTLGFAGPTLSAVDLLPNKRYYAGGAGSVRGFRRHMIGPLDPFDKPLGGLAKIETSTEIRFPLFWLLSGAVFADGGQVWFTRGSIDLRDMQFAAGPGVMFRTPIGPVRLDFGIRVSRGDPSLPRVVPSLSIGQSF